MFQSFFFQIQHLFVSLPTCYIRVPPTFNRSLCGSTVQVTIVVTDGRRWSLRGRTNVYFKIYIRILCIVVVFSSTIFQNSDIPLKTHTRTLYNIYISTAEQRILEIICTAMVVGTTTRVVLTGSAIVDCV